jgi:transcriptional regulator with PAS, ATPase and Fis domain
VAPYYRAALVLGETGTGKELVARALHRLSPVSSGPFVVVNCSAVVETLFESELFGHVQGSFTGATRDKPGLFEHAHQGTLFLDEIGDMPFPMQAKLLRALQNREVRRVGGLNSREVDVHVVAATNHDLRNAVGAKCFREDLYYRLSMVEVHVPCLAERLEDLALLEQHLIAQFAIQFNKPVRGLTQRAHLCVARHSWPGNIRELENVLGQACMLTTSNFIDVQDLPLYLQYPQHRRAERRDMLRQNGFMEHISGRSDRRELIAGSDVHGSAYSLVMQERQLIVDALNRTNGNQTGPLNFCRSVATNFVIDLRSTTSLIRNRTLRRILLVKAPSNTRGAESIDHGLATEVILNNRPREPLSRYRGSRYRPLRRRKS